jgi:hypothetical protein
VFTTPFDRFRILVGARIDVHPVVRSNRYTTWFSTGLASLEELRRFTVQFSVFSHLFLEEQLRKCINASDLAAHRAAREILLNELGVTFTSEGSIDGGRCTFRAAHFEWLADFAHVLGLRFDEIGKRHLGTPETLAFCDALMIYYGSSDPSTAAGASYAIEHWAAAGFWKQLIAGMEVMRARQVLPLPLGFWKWHDALEETHVEHTDAELADAFEAARFMPANFLQSGTAMLDAVHKFWEGLYEARISDDSVRSIGFARQ